MFLVSTRNFPPELGGMQNVMEGLSNALINHVQGLDKPSDKINSIAVVSRGEYGFAKGVWAGMPTRTVSSGNFEIVKGMEHNSFAKEALERTNDELTKEREMVNEFL